MKKWIRRIIVLFCTVTIAAALVGYCGYRQLMGDVRIVQYFNSAAENLDWQAVRIRAIVPEEGYKEGWTVNAMRIYVIIRSRRIPNRIDIIIYDNMEKFEKCEEYTEVSFDK